MRSGRRPSWQRRVQAGCDTRPVQAGGPYGAGSGCGRWRMSKHTITVTVNGQAHTRDVEARTLLVHFIREDLSLTGTHIGCDTTNCGACTILLDGVAVKSCTLFAVQADGA